MYQSARTKKKALIAAVNQGQRNGGIVFWTMQGDAVFTTSPEVKASAHPKHDARHHRRNIQELGAPGGRIGPARMF